MDPVLVSALIQMGLNQWADYQDRQAKGTITDADVDAMIAALDAKISGFQALIDAHKAVVAKA